MIKSIHPYIHISQAIKVDNYQNTPIDYSLNLRHNLSYSEQLPPDYLQGVSHSPKQKKQYK